MLFYIVIEIHLRNNFFSAMGSNLQMGIILLTSKGIMRIQWMTQVKHLAYGKGSIRDSHGFYNPGIGVAVTLIHSHDLRHFIKA